MKKLIIVFLLISAFVNLGFSAPKKKDYTPTENNVRLLGRAISKNKTVIMAHSATGIEFNVSAKKLSATFFKDSWHRDVRIVAFLDDERIMDEVLKEDSKEYILFDSKEVKSGVVRIVQASECMMANSGIKKLSTDGEGLISPTEERRYKIEFLGDSATAGYGVDEKLPYLGFKIETEDITKSYAYKTALALEADYSVICGSGWGVISGYTDGPKRTDVLIPNIYDKVGFYDVMVGTEKPGEIKWDFNRFKPDIVSVLLGTNDINYTKGLPDRCQEFQEGYLKFIYELHAKNPDSYILCCSGLAPDDLEKQIEAAVSEYKAQTGDTEISYLHIPLHNPLLEGWGADYHPSDKAYTNATNYLVPKLREILDRR